MNEREVKQHDWGIDSYRCLDCGTTRDDAPDQYCKPRYIETSSEEVLQRKSWRAGNTVGSSHYISLPADWSCTDYIIITKAWAKEHLSAPSLEALGFAK